VVHFGDSSGKGSGAVLPQVPCAGPRLRGWVFGDSGAASGSTGVSASLGVRSTALPTRYGSFIGWGGSGNGVSLEEPPQAQSPRATKSENETWRADMALAHSTRSQRSRGGPFSSGSR
jgi:hypothetical protein